MKLINEMSFLKSNLLMLCCKFFLHNYNIHNNCKHVVQVQYKYKQTIIFFRPIFKVAIIFYLIYTGFCNNNEFNAFLCSNNWFHGKFNFNYNETVLISLILKYHFSDCYIKIWLHWTIQIYHQYTNKILYNLYNRCISKF